MLTALATIGLFIVGIVVLVGIWRELRIDPSTPHCRRCGKAITLTPEDIQDGVNRFRCCEEWQDLFPNTK